MFEGMLEGPNAGGVRFSVHAQQRMASRNLRLDPGQEAGVARALDHAASKGARESLLVLDGMSLVVSVPNRTVITAVPHGEAGDAVFTHIDSAVVVSKDAAAASQ
jgi:flagellar operon protein